MGIADRKPVKSNPETLKMPPLEKPRAFAAAVDAIMAAEPPSIGPQVLHQKLSTMFAGSQVGKNYDKLWYPNFHFHIDWLLQSVTR